MKKITMMLPLLLTGYYVQAGTVTCTGTESGYDFTIQAPFSGSSLTGNITAVVTQSGSQVTTQTLQTTGSKIVPDQSIEFSGKNSEATGTINATYSSSAGDYSGDVNASTSFGNFDINLTCNLSGD